MKNFSSFLAMVDSFPQQEKLLERHLIATENFYQGQIRIDRQKKIFNRVQTQQNRNYSVEVRKNK